MLNFFVTILNNVVNTIAGGGPLEYATFDVNVAPTTLAIGLAPVATEIDANGMVSVVGDVTYPITPADVGAGSFVATDQIYIDHNKPDGVISAGLNGGALSEVYGPVEAGWDRTVTSAGIGTSVSLEVAGNLYVAVRNTNFSNLTVSTDSGATWSAVVTISGVPYPKYLISDGTTLTSTSWTGTQLYTSTDGTTWTAGTGSLLNGSTSIFRNATSGIIVAGNDGFGAVNITYSTDGGSTWAASGTGGAAGFSIIAGDGDDEFLGVESNSGINTVYRSTDGGVNFAQAGDINTGYSQSYNSRGQLRRLMVGAVPYYFFCDWSGTSNGKIGYSSDSGDTWTNETFPSAPHDFIQDGDDVLAIGLSDNSVYRFDGVSWTNEDPGIAGGIPHTATNNGTNNIAIATNDFYEILTAEAGVTEDLQPVFFSDGANTDVTIDKSVVVNDKTDKTYTLHNGTSRVLTVKTTGGDYTTVQLAVDWIVASGEGNETVVVFDGISLTPAVGLPANAQVVDVEPDYIYYEPFA